MNIFTFALWSLLLKLFHVENRHIYEVKLISKQCNNYENEFTFPVLVQAFPLTPLKTELQFCTRLKLNVMLSTKHELIENIYSRREGAASMKDILFEAYGIKD